MHYVQEVSKALLLCVIQEVGSISGFGVIMYTVCVVVVVLAVHTV